MTTVVPYPLLLHLSVAHLKITLYFYFDSLKLKKVRLRTTFASADTAFVSVQLSCCEHYGNVLNEYSKPELKAVSLHLVGHNILMMNLLMPLPCLCFNSLVYS